MKAQFSEFTYGFALVNELTNVLSCTTVPIFPSLREEGTTGGGYDARMLSKKGSILYLQFKLSEKLKYRSAREFKMPGHSLNLPYYRFEIASRRISKQHSLLRILEASSPLTFYVAPVFHLDVEIDAYWTSTEVTKHSVFVKPSSIGDLSDNLTHRIGFDKSSIAKNKAYLFSDPKMFEIDTYESFSEFVISQINEEDTLEHSIKRIFKSYASVIEQIEDSTTHQKTPEIFEEHVLPRPQERIDYQPRNLKEDLLNPPEGTHLLRLMAEVSTFFLGVQAVAVVQGES